MNVINKIVSVSNSEEKKASHGKNYKDIDSGISSFHSISRHSLRSTSHNSNATEHTK